MQVVMAFITGLVFGLGLLLSGMADPSKVIGFLDLAGNWDPSLAFVMGGAILAAAVAFQFAKGRTKAWLGDVMRMPAASQIDRRLVLGSLTFGAGWGLAGYCPGPALASLAHGGNNPLIFVAAMLVGMAVYEIRDRLVTVQQHKAAWDRNEHGLLP
ncbi:DUF6691 family protein [Herbaspirillum sp. GCM10030257]|uniref:YeeE/YedE family protein n=1 Tax=Herbaspirillum sp. GCM10030257 TaxID=3273393 RepID=UPI0036168CE3